VNGKYIQKITLKNGNRKYIGVFDNELESVYARDLAEVSEWHEFANTNVV
jgi:hypothetical protein